MVSRGVTSSPSNYNLFFPNKRQGNSTSAVVTFHHVLPSIPRYNAFTTLLLVVYENRGKERGTSSPLELDQHFWKIQNNNQAVAVAVAVPAVLRSGERRERRERRETTGESLPGLWGGRKGSDLIVLERSGSGTEFALADFLFLLLLLKTG